MKLAEILHKELREGKFWTHSRTLVDGCTKVSPGCKNCWSEALAQRFGNHVGTYDKGFNGCVIEHPERLADILPKSEKRKPRVWTYWNDLFHESVSDELRNQLFTLITQSKDFHIICTKRPFVALKYLAPKYLTDKLAKPNVIILVSMEDQKRANERLPWLAQISTFGWKVGALCEPMLTPIDLTGEWGAYLSGNGPIRKQWIDCLSWIVCGPENGSGKRYYDAQWAMRLQAQAQRANIPFFYKAGLLNEKEYIETP